MKKANCNAVTMVVAQRFVREAGVADAAVPPEVEAGSECPGGSQSDDRGRDVPHITERDMAEVLNIPVPVVHQMLERSELAGFKRGGCVVYPCWQVTAEGALIPHLKRVLETVQGVDATSLQAMMLHPREELGRLTPIEWLLSGRSVEMVVQSLRGVV